jgi:two-component system, OmpR family, KDP operon response regulator KdpE
MNNTPDVESCLAVSAERSIGDGASVTNRILVVEDEQVIAFFIGQTLREEGYGEVTMAATAQEAMNQLTQNVPDAVVIDLGLPDGNGTELIRTLRQDHGIPIIITTGFDTRELVREFEDDRNTCVLGKPFDVPDLLACLSSLNVLPSHAAGR